MEAAVDQCSVDKNAFEIQIKQLSIDDDQLLKQIMSQEIMHIAVNFVDILKVNKSCVGACNKCLKLETELLKKKDLIEKDFVDNSDLNAQLQEKVFAIATLKNELRKLKGKNVVETAVSKSSGTIATGMFKLDIEPISHRLKNNRDAHEVYLEKTIENNDTLCGLVECARKQNPSEPLLESACMFTKHVQELLVYVSKTCPSLTKPCEKLVAGHTNMNKDKTVYGLMITCCPNCSVVFGLRLLKAYDQGYHSPSAIQHRSKFLGTVRFGNDHIAKIMGSEGLQMG
ncbi:hypothetical protein Tco_0402153 [Tanacetum coccineum]